MKPVLICLIVLLILSVATIVVLLEKWTEQKTISMHQYNEIVELEQLLLEEEFKNARQLIQTTDLYQQDLRETEKRHEQNLRNLEERHEKELADAHRVTQMLLDHEQKEVSV